MNLALQKTLGLLMLIVLGILLQRKVSSQENLKGIKILILSVALPATIFVALLKSKLESSLIFLPVLALIFNFIMLAASKYFLGFFGVEKSSPVQRTLMMLLPSLAPGISCFPFIMEYLGDSSLAQAALADVGNKVFVLILLYIMAMHWHHRTNGVEVARKGKFKNLLLSMINEPINIVILIAMILLGFGIDLSAFPTFLENTILRMSVLMTPLVLLFIGLAVRIKWREFHLIIFLLTWRSGVTFCLSALLVYLLPALSPAMVLLAVVFPQSACSFWPFAHMSTIQHLEEKVPVQSRTFNINFALSILACSLPFSTILILGILSFSEWFINPVYLLVTGVFFLGISGVPFILKKIKESGSKESVERLPLFPEFSQEVRPEKASIKSTFKWRVRRQ